MQNNTTRIEKIVNGKDATFCGAFFPDDKISFRIHIPRTLGVHRVIFRACADGCADTDRSAGFSDTDWTRDTYEITLEVSELLSADGLIYYTADHYESFELLYGEP